MAFLWVLLKRCKERTRAALKYLLQPTTLFSPAMGVWQGLKSELIRCLQCFSLWILCSGVLQQRPHDKSVPMANHTSYGIIENKAAHFCCKESVRACLHVMSAICVTWRQSHSPLAISTTLVHSSGVRELCTHYRRPLINWTSPLILFTVFQQLQSQSSPYTVNTIAWPTGQVFKPRHFPATTSAFLNTTAAANRTSKVCVFLVFVSQKEERFHKLKVKGTQEWQYYGPNAGQ